jgi:LacI family transcriptional regulator
MTRSSPPERGSPERPQSTTIRTVAEAAKVSVATVSRVINGNEGVQPKLAARVHQAIQRLNYIPSTQARSMRSGRSRVLGVIAPECANPLSPAMVHSFHNAAAEYDCDVLFYHLDSKAMPIDIYVRRLIERDAEGIVVVASQLHQVPANHTWQPRIPMVFIDVGSPAKDAAVISIDYTQGIRQAVQHLAALGHRRIAFSSRQIELLRRCNADRL